MSNTKISALTSATTPLAGTEVLPIVQSGVTVKVANNDLRPKQLQSNATSGVHQIVGPAAATTRVMTVPDANFTAARTDAAQSFTGDQTLSTGNLIQGTSAKGINFTANTPASGMTSQLLNWYEEGTWTPSVTSQTGAILTVGSVSGKYVRIGKSITIEFSITITLNGTGATSVVVAGLPYSISADTAGAAHIQQTGVLCSSKALGGTSQVYLLKYDGTYPGANGYQIYGSLVYIN